MKQLKITMIFFFIFATSCVKEEILLNQPRDEDRSVGAYLANNFEYSLFAYALERANLLDSLLYGDGPYTVLALRNKDLQQQGVSSKADIDSFDPDLLSRLLAYHVLPIELSLEDIPFDQFGLEYPTLSEEVLRTHKCLVTIGNPDQWGAEIISFSGSQVVNRLSEEDPQAPLENLGDWKFTNGIVHTVDKLIKLYTHLDVRSFLESMPDYSIFVSGLKHFGIWDRLTNDQVYTVFAPPNSAFEAFGIDEAVITDLDTNRFNSQLLFEVYFMRDRLFFVRDYDFYLQKDGQFWMFETLNDTPPYNRIVMGHGRFTQFGGQYHYRTGEFDYTIGITKLDEPYHYAVLDDQFQYYLGGSGLDAVGDFVCGGRSKFDNDYIVSNGLVHRLDHLLVHLEEATR